jgi:hypothetical protein
MATSAKMGVFSPERNEFIPDSLDFLAYKFGKLCEQTLTADQSDAGQIVVVMVGLPARGKSLIAGKGEP